MKAYVYIFLFSLAVLGSYPLIQHLQVPLEQNISGTVSCCCDPSEDSCCEIPADQDEEKSHDCDSGCDCACKYHVNALYFQFSNLQVAEEQEYHYGEYVNAYSFEFFSLHIPPPRLG
jgi:hypothetical protein